MGHVTPEAYLGGPIAFVEDGDRIYIDIPAGRIDLDITPHVLEERQSKWRIPQNTKLDKRSLLERYRRLVGPAIKGAIFE